MSKSPEKFASLQNAGVSANDRWLVRGVDMDLSSGEIVTIVGPNGSGKSTTIKLLLGIIEPSEGAVQIKSRIRTAYVPQKLAVDWSMPLTVGRFMNLTHTISLERRKRALDRVGAAHLLEAGMTHLSGGELQRVLLARAIAGDPQLLVLDEPVQGVDFTGQIELYELISTIRDEIDCGIVMVSHDLHLVMAATDRVICLNGHVCCQGTPTNVAMDEQYQKLFGPKAAETLAFYKHEHDHEHLADGRVRHADGTITDHCHPGDGHHDHHHSDAREHDDDG